FAMLIPHCEGAIEEFAKLLQQELDAYPLSMNLLLAFGVYPVDGVCAPVDVMCDRANIAIRKVKGNYNQHIAYYDAEMRSALMAEQTVLNEMEWALETQQFILYFQPKYDLPTGAIIGAEALVRWQHPQKGLILPGAFIPVFENNGFITRLDGYVWERTCQVLQGWLAAGAHPLPVSVNISRVNFYDPTLCDRLVALVKQYELTPNLLELELTESAYTENPQQLIAVTKELQRNGFVILMDDFGSGYSSLNMLKDVPVDILKIDLGFLECNANAGRGCNILSSVVRMAKWLDIPVIAEGVETCEQVNFLRGIGCNSAQGYYYSKPVPQDVYEALLAKQDSTVPEFPSVSPVCENFDLSELLNPHSTINLLFNSFSDSVGIYEFYGEKLEALRVNEGY
ncbi:MAG: EAL domain-containing protein, partial [Pygmaiobacter sp.]